MGVLQALRGDNGSGKSDADALLTKLVAEVAASSANEEIFKERIAELELALEDRGWERMTSMDGEFQFTRKALDDIIHLSRLYYVKNPVIRRPVELQAVYVWAQGVSIYANEESVNAIVQGFISDPSNRRSFTGHDALMDSERRLRVEGNWFLRFFTNPTTGRVRVRRLPVEEMRAVVFNPEDRDEPWFYIRKFKKNGEDQTVAYPDWRYARQRKVEEAGGERPAGGGVRMDVLKEYEDARIEWDTPVMHRKTGGFSDMDFGIPEVYPALDWAKAYKLSLEDYRKTIRSLATWAWKMKMGGSQAQLNAAATALGTTFGTDDSWTETNPTPVAGSMFAYTGDMDMRAIDVSKAAVDPDGFRRLLLMAASAVGMPEMYYGAADSTFATAKAMDRPTELQFRDRQTLWAEVIIDVLTVAVEAAAVAVKNDTLRSLGYDEATGLMRLEANGKEIPLRVEVDYPPILQKDVQEFLQALTTFTTQNGQAVQAMNDGPTLYRLALNALGVDNVEEIVQIFYPKDGSPSKAKEIETFAAPKTPTEVNAENAAYAAAASSAPLGNQPLAQGPAGGDNGEPTGRGGPNAVAREADYSVDEVQARIDFMNSLIEMRREARADRAARGAI